MLHGISCVYVFCMQYMGSCMPHFHCHVQDELAMDDDAAHILWLMHGAVEGTRASEVMEKINT